MKVKRITMQQGYNFVRTDTYFASFLNAQVRYSKLKSSQGSALFGSLSLAYFSIQDIVGWFERLGDCQGYRTQVDVRVVAFPFSGFILGVQVAAHPCNIVSKQGCLLERIAYFMDGRFLIVLEDTGTQDSMELTFKVLKFGHLAGCYCWISGVDTFCLWHYFALSFSCFFKSCSTF